MNIVKLNFFQLVKSAYESLDPFFLLSFIRYTGTCNDAVI